MSKSEEKITLSEFFGIVIDLFLAIAELVFNIVLWIMLILAMAAFMSFCLWVLKVTWWGLV